LIFFFLKNKFVLFALDMPPATLKVGKASNDALALTNCLVVSKQDFPPGHPSTPKYVLLNRTFAFTLLCALWITI
jgi:hypothetical protein